MLRRAATVGQIMALAVVIVFERTVYPPRNCRRVVQPFRSDRHGAVRRQLHLCGTDDASRPGRGTVRWPVLREVEDGHRSFLTLGGHVSLFISELELQEQVHESGFVVRVDDGRHVLSSHVVSATMLASPGTGGL